ncbi:hypothetical protein DNTS_001301 [Danionella cerebrum]|uniref:Uncharacterized protein n=1 Tax=Danionella cerebrum TaxID=2873325 RepID=A0A553Q3Q1_9TELE|nr:hypothetical protein DNTS_001301 [Danionella translucida]
MVGFFTFAIIILSGRRRGRCFPGPWIPSEARPLGSTGQVTCTHSRGLQRDRDCITAATLAENGTIITGASEGKTEATAGGLQEAGIKINKTN